jgi:hypothetical protein
MARRVAMSSAFCDHVYGMHEGRPTCPCMWVHALILSSLIMPTVQAGAYICSIYLEHELSSDRYNKLSSNCATIMQAKACEILMVCSKDYGRVLKAAGYSSPAYRRASTLRRSIGHLKYGCGDRCEASHVTCLFSRRYILSINLYNAMCAHLDRSRKSMSILNIPRGFVLYSIDSLTSSSSPLPLNLYLLCLFLFFNLTA